MDAGARQRAPATVVNIATILAPMSVSAAISASVMREISSAYSARSCPLQSPVIPVSLINSFPLSGHLVLIPSQLRRAVCHSRLQPKCHDARALWAFVVAAAPFAVARS